MLFLVIGEIKGTAPLPPDQLMGLAVQEWEMALKFKKEGKIIAGGALAGRKGGCGIWDVESVEELNSLVSQLPLYMFLDIEIIPLTSAEFALESVKQAYAALTAAK